MTDVASCVQVHDRTDVEKAVDREVREETM
jgi:hypothetical protein